MKTKTNIFKLITLLYFFIIMLFSWKSYADLTASDWITASTSWVKYTYYEVTWCSPHYTEITSLTQICEKWYFYNNGWVWVMTYKWENFKNWNVKVKTWLPWVTRTSSVWLLDLFDVSSIKFEWEWTYTINVLLVDYAYNASKFDFTYKIDKTAPQFQLTSITENTPYTYVDTSLPRLSWLNWNIVKYDSNTNISNDPDKYTNPWLVFTDNTYTWDIPVERTWHQRQNLYVFYFKDVNSWDWAWKPFNLNVTYSDNYNSYLKWWTTLVSWVDKPFALMPETWNIPIKSNISLWTVAWLVTSDLTSNSDINSQKKYRLRLYDNSTWKNWWDSNFSEITFYAVRDNTAPNMWWNGLASTSNEASQRALKFDSSTTVWDTWATPSNSETSWAVSKFISATSSKTLYSTLSDIWIWWSDSTKYSWYNAWIPLSGTTKIQIETSGDKTSYSDVFSYSNRFINTDVTRNKDFSIVDLDRQNWYRKYTAKFVTTWITWDNNLCDNVWNCLSPKIDFRVVANAIATTTSNISLASPVKVFANWTDKYTITSNFEDTYWNKIVWVTAVENWNKIIKTVDTYFDFENWLYSDQKSDTPSWTKLAIINDAQIDNSTSTTSTINSSSNIYFKEIAESWANTNAWVYSFYVASKVPTSWLYPYLSNNTKIKLTSIRPRAIEWTISWVWIYPTSISWLWLFSWNVNLWNATNFLTYDKAWIDNWTTTTDLSSFNSANYWKITLSNANDVKYNTLSLRKLELEFASPFVYGMENFSLSPLYSFNAYASHTKKLYELSTWVGFNKIFEQFLSAYGSDKHTSWVVNFDYKNSSIWNVNNWYSFAWNYYRDNMLLANWLEFEVKSSPALSSYDSNNELKYWYVSYLAYDLWWYTIYIPSVSRNVSNLLTWWNNSKLSSRFYFPDWNTPYVIIWDWVTNLWVWPNLSIAVTGLTNRNMQMTDDTTWSKASVNIWENVSRYDLITTFKKNVSSLSSWLWGTSWVDWCENLWIINQNFINNGDNKNCTIDINWEKVSFIKWSVNIDCWSNNCVLPNNVKRTIIVQDGYTYIKSNISTYNKSSQLLIWTLSQAGLQNIDIPDDLSFDITTQPKTKWWTFIDSKVTNIDAFIVSQWPMVTYDQTKTKLYWNTIEANELRNQLQIYGSVLSLNTIWGFKDVWLNFECPYIIDNCTSNESAIFDLVFLRRYNLIWKKFYDDTYTWTEVAAYHPNWYDIAKRSWWKTWYFNLTDSESCWTPDSDLRCITDSDYKKYPLFIQRDTMWNSSPSIMFSVD